jgi:hypothetical protein
MLTKNLRSVPLLPDIEILSPVSNTNLPGRRFTVSPAGTGNAVTIGVDVAPLL